MPSVLLVLGDAAEDGLRAPGVKQNAPKSKARACLGGAASAHCQPPRCVPLPLSPQAAQCTGSPAAPGDTGSCCRHMWGPGAGVRREIAVTASCWRSRVPSPTGTTASPARWPPGAAQQEAGEGKWGRERLLSMQRRIKATRKGEDETEKSAAQVTLSSVLVLFTDNLLAESALLPSLTHSRAVHLCPPPPPTRSAAMAGADLAFQSAVGYVVSPKKKCSSLPVYVRDKAFAEAVELRGGYAGLGWTSIQSHCVLVKEKHGHPHTEWEGRVTTEPRTGVMTAQAQGRQDSSQHRRERGLRHLDLGLLASRW